MERASGGSRVRQNGRDGTIALPECLRERWCEAGGVRSPTRGAGNIASRAWYSAQHEGTRDAAQQAAERGHELVFRGRLVVKFELGDVA